MVLLRVYFYTVWETKEKAGNSREAGKQKRRESRKKRSWRSMGKQKIRERQRNRKAENQRRNN